jgi:hypothetical protein
MCCGDTTFPGTNTRALCCIFVALSDGDSVYVDNSLTPPLPAGIGLPATAASGAIVANTLANVGSHIEMLERIGL